MHETLLMIRSYLHGIWQYRWSALLISWIVALLGWVFVYTIPNQYTSHTILHIDTQSIMKPLLKGLAVESDVDAGMNLMTKILLSRESLEEVIRETDMDLQMQKAGDMSTLIAQLAESIELRVESSKSKRVRRGGGDIYEISYTHQSPELAYQVVSKLLNIMIENTLSTARADTAQAQKFIDEQIRRYEQRLVEAEEALAKFKRENIGLMPDESGGYYQRLQRAQADLRATESEIQLAKRKLAQLRRQLSGEAPLLDNNAYGSSRAMKLKQYREDLQNLLSRYTEQHPDVKALQDAIAILEAGGDVTLGGDESEGSNAPVEFNPVYQDIKSEIVKTTVEIEALQLKYAEQKKTVQNLRDSVNIIPEVEAQLAKLNRDYEITRNRYLSFVERRESAALAQQVGQSGSDISFRVIEPPRVPVKPSKPNRMLLLLGVLAVAFAAGLGWGFLRYLLQPTFIDTSQVHDQIELPVLGSVSLYLTPEHKHRRRLQLATFIMATMLLVIAFGGVLALKDSGARLVQQFITTEI